jgi:hypothetical protein
VLSQASVWQAPKDARGALTALSLIDERTAVVGTITGDVFIVDLVQGRETTSFELGSRVGGLAFDPETQQIIAGLADGRIVWLGKDVKAITRTLKAPGPVLAFRKLSNDSRIIVGTGSGVMLITTSGEVLWKLIHSHAGRVQGLSFYHDRRRIIWGGSGAYLWMCTVPLRSGDKTRVSVVKVFRTVGGLI